MPNSKTPDRANLVPTLCPLCATRLLVRDGAFLAMGNCAAGHFYAGGTRAEFIVGRVRKPRVAR